MLRHPLTNFKIRIYYQNRPKFSGVYSKYNLAKIKDAPYVINLDEYKSIGADWIAFYVIDDNVTRFDSFENFLGNKTSI